MFSSLCSHYVANLIKNLAIRIMVVFFVLLNIKFGHGQNRYADVEKKPVSTPEYHYRSHASYNLGKNLTSNKILVTYTLVLTNTKWP